MSIFSDYKCGAMDYDEFKQACARMNAEDRYDREHMYDNDEDEGEPITETAEAKWHTEPPTCAGEFYVTLAYEFEAGGAIYKGRCINIAEYDYRAKDWIFENPEEYLLKQGAQVVAWSVLPEPYDGEVKGVCK